MGKFESAGERFREIVARQLKRAADAHRDSSERRSEHMGDNLEAIQRKDRERLTARNGENISGNSPPEVSPNPKRREDGKGPSNPELGAYGERQTEAHMRALGYERISKPGKHTTATGIDDMFIHVGIDGPGTGHIAIVESKYNTAGLRGDQMSARWLLRRFRPDGTNRIQDALDRTNAAGITASHIQQGLREGVVSRVLSHIDDKGNVTISVL